MMGAPQSIAKRNMLSSSSSSSLSPWISAAAGGALSNIWKSQAENRPPKGAAQGAEALIQPLKARDIYSLEAVAASAHCRNEVEPWPVPASD